MRERNENYILLDLVGDSMFSYTYSNKSKKKKKIEEGWRELRKAQQLLQKGRRNDGKEIAV